MYLALSFSPMAQVKSTFFQINGTGEAHLKKLGNVFEHF